MSSPASLPRRCLSNGAPRAALPRQTRRARPHHGGARDAPLTFARRPPSHPRARVRRYAYGFFGYWRSPVNGFDGSLVLLTVMELILTAYNDEAEGRVSGVRILRLLRFIRAARMVRVFRIVLRVYNAVVNNGAEKVAPSGETSTKKKEVKEENHEKVAPPDE
eukprot:5366241-Prymnesium_polylepis.1